MHVRPKKHLGQHFLKNPHTADRIVQSLTHWGNYGCLLEIGAGTGVLTQRLLRDTRFALKVVEIDHESVDYLKKELRLPDEQLIVADFLTLDLSSFAQPTLGLIGNLPYNISSPIFFKVFENKHIISEMVCMVQKEVAQRIVAPPGGKTNGILSILLQTFYHVRYLFKVGPEQFVPPPKVDSAVISLQRNERKQLPCDEKLFVKVVKQGYNMRRKTLRNALKPLGLPDSFTQESLFDKRAEQLSVEDFIELTCRIAKFENL
ncbi:MAG: 16S rRNA (adenine(1518)-N(6)/adenine(1519)-N(6))-dimethyltransferase RsmA [Flammeovirgaceae bacterium]|nr:16S rRNA (adenine(1518)-N(6)/adenine(1519)-N(6))-dimethyltransferase RsmA [Flammeovirgaceae bacterium]MDW8288477.1 16S rRNA (adenine(1518)-N(6)/adenine(1519)-N(6))-dimethyltransferase RsmA [Flammeovirgaceae bacterium]